MSRLGIQEPDIAEVFDGMFPDECKRELIVMLRAFTDAGQTYPEASAAPAYTVAGFMGELRNWSKFQKKWREARLDAGLQHFRMSDFMARAKRHGFDKLSASKHAAILDRLTTLIVNNVSFGVSMSIWKSDYEALTAEEKRYLCNDNPFLLCANLCITKLAFHMKKRDPNEKFMAVYELGDKGEKVFTASMLEMQEKNIGNFEKMGLIAITGGEKKAFPHLDAADCLAWEVNRYLPIKFGFDNSPIRPTFQRVLPKIYMYHWPYKELILCAHDNKKEVGAFKGRVIPSNPKRPFTW